MPIKINASFNQKDEVKKLGAIWLPDVKTWVIPDNIKDINGFKPWLPQQGGTIVKYPYFVLKSERKCWKCYKDTPLIGLGAQNYFTTVFNSPKDVVWQTYPYPVLFVDIRYIDNEIAAALKMRFPFFQPVNRRGENTWINTCIHCQTIQGDEYNTDRHYIFGGYQGEKMFNGKETESLQLSFDYYINAAVDEGAYYFDGYTEME